MTDPLTLSEFIIKRQCEHSDATGDLSQILGAISLASKIVHREINKAGLLDITGSAGKENIQGETQQKLDVYANEKFKNALEARGNVCAVASEEEEHFVQFSSHQDGRSKYVVAMDPVDGSSNIDVNIPVGTIFSIYRRISSNETSVDLGDFCRHGRDQVAAGYVIYGSSTMLVYTTGNGVNGFTFDASVGEYFLSHEDIRFPENGSIYSVNEGNSPRYSDGVRRYIDLCKSTDNLMGKPYAARYVGSFVADFHRNLLKGGVFLYPALDSYPEGKLRILYECAPMAMLAEQAGGKASNGSQAILDVSITQLHQRCPIVIGSAKMVDEVLSIVDNLN